MANIEHFLNISFILLKPLSFVESLDARFCFLYKTSLNFSNLSGSRQQTSPENYELIEFKTRLSFILPFEPEKRQVEL
jgi:hypothetical protein